MIKRSYDYIFWRCYDLISLTGKYDLGWSASYFLSLTQSIFCFGLFSVFNLKRCVNLFQLQVLCVTVYLILLAINYLIFVRGEKYKSIISLFQNENITHKKIGRIAVVILYLWGAYNLF